MSEELAYAYYEKGVMSWAHDEPNDALIYLNKSLDLVPDDVDCLDIKGSVLCDLKKYDEAARVFADIYTSVIELLIWYNEDDEQELLNSYLDYDVFFNRIIESLNLSEVDKEFYKDIYIQSLRIICKLHVNNSHEKTVAHYTRKSIAEILLFPQRNENNEPVSQPCLQLGTIVTANDPKEGGTLFDYLFNEKRCTCEHKPKQNVVRDYQAFISCFTFNHDSLNQFRLYGKENNKEATGVSLVLNSEFFHYAPVIKQPFISSGILKKSLDENNRKLALFRCIYIDPVSQQVVSLGHREAYTFYRDKISDDDYAVYEDDYKTNLHEVKEELAILKEMVSGEGVNRDVVCELLMNLRYLVKHVAFKEEQECRILDIVALDDNRVKIAENRMYIEYSGVDIAPNVKKVYFAPKTEGFAFFL